MALHKWFCKQYLPIGYFYAVEGVVYGGHSGLWRARRREGGRDKGGVVTGFIHADLQVHHHVFLALADGLARVAGAAGVRGHALGARVVSTC